MAAIPRDTTRTVQVDGVTAMTSPGPSGNLYAGEALDACAPCYIATDGFVYMSDGAAVGVENKIIGIVPVQTAIGGIVDLLAPNGLRVHWAAAGTLTPGNVIYLGAVPGGIDTAAQLGDTTGIGMAINDSMVSFNRTKHSEGA